MGRVFQLTLGLLLLAGPALAAPQAQKKQPSIRCTLTDKKITKCCCEPREGKLYCSLAKKTIDKCCCEPLQTPKGKKN